MHHFWFHMHFISPNKSQDDLLHKYIFLFYDWLHYLLPFRLGCAVNTNEKGEDSIIQNESLYGNPVCRVAPGFGWAAHSINGLKPPGTVSYRKTKTIGLKISNVLSETLLIVFKIGPHFYLVI